MMKQNLFLIALVVDDYDTAINYYTRVLNFDLIEDEIQSPTKRWVVVKPKGSGCGILLAKGASDEQKTRIGNQTGGRVFLFLHTDNFDRDFADYQKKGVVFIRETTIETYGKVNVFKDLYGNLWDLIEPN
jgi:catechol 2,3-dioxygenase-like lactoylglutathione lyase family enzyme